MDLGTVQSIQAVSAWSFNQNGIRGRQIVTIFGSTSVTDPGWDVRDSSRFVPLGSIDTTSLGDVAFTASSLRAPQGKSLGDFRWVVWRTAPVTKILENTSWQEIAVELVK
jgi:hypothetical protein